mmetsp:Transcript_15899/g.20765  ORF Transcript_15899/g.20765 Transcript_15899/m.20765 type:complete len:207 (+) Transcript_15899:5-625(+)
MAPLRGLPTAPMKGMTRGLMWVHLTELTRVPMMDFEKEGLTADLMVREKGRTMESTKVLKMEFPMGPMSDMTMVQKMARLKVPQKAAMRASTMAQARGNSKVLKMVRPKDSTTGCRRAPMTGRMTVGVTEHPKAVTMALMKVHWKVPRMGTPMVPMMVLTKASTTAGKTVHWKGRCLGKMTVVQTVPGMAAQKVPSKELTMVPWKE